MDAAGWGWAGAYVATMRLAVGAVAAPDVATLLEGTWAKGTGLERAWAERLVEVARSGESHGAAGWLRAARDELSALELSDDVEGVVSVEDVIESSLEELADRAVWRRPTRVAERNGPLRTPACLADRCWRA